MSAKRNKSKDRENTLALLSDIAQGATVKTDIPNWLGHIGDGTSKIDAELLWGSTLSWTGPVPRGAIDSHIWHLRVEHGLTVQEHNGVFRLLVLPLENEA